MAERKSIGEAIALSDKALDFIKGGRAEPPKAIIPEKIVELPITGTPEDSGPHDEAAAEEAKTPRRGKRRASSGALRPLSDPRDIADILVSTSFRLRYSSVEALNDAWLDRKRLHRKAKLQDIAQEAVDEWLKKHDYID